MQKNNSIILPNGEFIKGGWVAPPYEGYAGFDGLKSEFFEDVKNSGINLLFAVIDPIKNFQELEKFLTLCDEQDIYAVVPEEGLGEKDFDLDCFYKRLEKYKEHKSFFGIDLCDEPGVGKFQFFEKYIKEIKPYMTDKLLYINNMPMYASEAQLFGGWWEGMGTEARIERYRDFLERFYSKVDVDIVSYDFYPFRHEKSICHPKYYIQLCMARDISRKYGKPLWNFTQVTSWFRETVRSMTYSEIAWLNNTSVACGVTGIQYFCYWTPSSSVEVFADAMVTAKGEKTRSYYFVQKANKKLQHFLPQILQAEYAGTIAFGDTLAYYPDEYNLNLFGEIKQIAGEGALIGCFEKEDKKMYFVVNTSVTECRVVEIFFKKKVRLTVNDCGDIYEHVGEKIILTVAEGEAVLLTEC